MEDVRFIKRLINEGEHQTLDFKYAITDSRKIARSLVAFANSDGGRLLIGVKDNGTIRGIRSDEERHMIDTAARLFCRPVPEYKVRAWEIMGKTILEVTVPEGQKRPFRAPDDQGSWHAYVRVADQTFIANRILVRAWKEKRSARGRTLTYTQPEKLLLHYLAHHPDIGFRSFVRLAKIPAGYAETILVRLLAWQIIDVRFTDRGTRYVLLNRNQSD